MNRHLGVVMDPIESINVKKDTTLALLLAAQRHNFSLFYLQKQDLYLLNGKAYGKGHDLTVVDSPERWFTLGAERDRPLAELGVILMRTDPPFDMEYVYATYILERAENEGALVVNRPQSLRDANEKLFTAWFPQCCPPTLASADPQRIKQFLAEHGDIIIKPPDGMGGSGIFRLRADDPNISVVLETSTGYGTRLALAQRYIPEIVDGDKRVLLVDGEPVPYALARMPAAGETRANLAVGGTGVGVELTARDRWICDQVASTLVDKGLMLVGLDVIGDYLTEINVTSPTCVRELDAQFELDIGGQLMTAIERHLG